jgi:hypothetical protein
MARSRQISKKFNCFKIKLCAMAAFSLLSQKTTINNFVLLLRRKAPGIWEKIQSGFALLGAARIKMVIIFTAA